MNYILFHTGKLPNHFFTCINNILSVDQDSEIFLLTDRDINLYPVKSLNFNDFQDLVTKKDQIIEIYKNTILEENPLWYSSFLRVFGLNTIANEFNLDKFIHFDNDVLIYKSFAEINNMNVIEDNKINITQNDLSRLVFGYSYFDNKQFIDYLIQFFEHVLLNHKKFSNEYHRGKPLSEMRILKLAQEESPEKFNILPSLPYSKNQIIFDPASYGQYLHGTHIKRGNYIFKRRWVSTDHIIGKELKSKRINIKFNNGSPIVKSKNSTSLLANLHVHSKFLNKFISNNYKAYIKN